MTEYLYKETLNGAIMTVDMAWTEPYLKSWLKHHCPTIPERIGLKPGDRWTPAHSDALALDQGSNRVGSRVEMPCLKPNTLEFLKIHSIRLPSGLIWTIMDGLRS